MLKYLFILFGLISSTVFSQTNPNRMLLRSTIGSSSPSKSVLGKKYIIQQSIGQSSVIGTNSKGGIILSQGYLQPLTKRINTSKASVLALKTTVSPNPFKDKITISFQEEIYTNLLVEIYDLSGKLIFATTYSASQTETIYLSDIPVSVYVLKVVANQKISLQKIIKISY